MLPRFLLIRSGLNASTVLVILLIGIIVYPMAAFHGHLERKRLQASIAANIAKLRQGRMLWAFATTKTDDDVVVAVRAEVTQQADGAYCLMLHTVSVVEVVTTDHVLPSWEELASYLAAHTILRVGQLKEA